MSNISQTINRLHSKVQKLIHLHTKLEQENNLLLIDKNSLLKKIEQLQTTNNTLEEKNKVLKLARKLSETDENTLAVKLKINELVREIDKSVALLNK